MQHAPSQRLLTGRLLYFLPGILYNSSYLVICNQRPRQMKQIFNSTSSSDTKKMAGQSALIVFIFMSLFTRNVHACIKTQRSSLLSFAFAFASPSSLNWSSSASDCCYWDGITCNQDGWITHLQLPFKGLKLKGSSFLLSLANLTYLTHLNLSHNSLSASLHQADDTLLSLKYLQVIDLSYNLLFGELPSSLPSSHIQLVDFSSNRLHGVIPSYFLRQAWNLTSFNVSNNTFSGPIPSSMCLPSSSLRRLDFSFNFFNGSIPSGLGKCSKLQVFRAGHNYLSGLLPEDICNLTTVEEISLPLNSLNGEISDAIANLIRLTTLDLSYNQLSGVLPLQLGNLSYLRYILLDFNSLQGSLPLTLMNCTNLVELRMGANNLGGNLSVFDFSKLSQLTKLDLRMNNLFGGLPRSLYSCKFLKAIRVSYNNLDIEVPSEIVSLKLLSFLSIGQNKRLLTNIKETMKTLMGCKGLVVLSLTSSFDGEAFPRDLGKADSDGFQNVRVLDLSSCNLTGELPLWLLKFRNLESLTLSYNRITGSIPSWLGSFPRLYSIVLDFNQLSGTIPTQLWTLPMFVSEQAAASVGTPLDLPIFYPSADYTKPIQYNYLIYEAMISLKGNNLQGNIPSEIGQALLLTYLDISKNNLSGNIPEQITNIKGFRALDLSMNHLFGSIPEAFTSLHFLAKFNVSYNNLQGSIPLGTQLQSFDASSFEGNLDLCGAPLPKCKSSNAPEINNTDEDTKKEKQVRWFYVAAALGFIIGFWGVIGPLVLLKKWRNAYYQFVENVYERFMVMIDKRIATAKHRFRTI